MKTYHENCVFKTEGHDFNFEKKLNDFNLKIAYSRQKKRPLKKNPEIHHKNALLKQERKRKIIRKKNRKDFFEEGRRSDS